MAGMSGEAVRRFSERTRVKPTFRKAFRIRQAFNVYSWTAIGAKGSPFATKREECPRVSPILGR